jgi:hypothetical protein
MGCQGGEWVASGIHRGLLNCRMLFCQGFGEDPKALLESYTQNNDPQNARYCKLGSPSESDHQNDHESGDEANTSEESGANSSPIGKRLIPHHKNFHWKILHGKRFTGQIASNIVVFGIEYVLSHTKGSLRFPTAKFGNYWVVDRDEIENFRSIRNLLHDHRDMRRTVPLSIAVFGPPGSGKSYGVREIAKSIGDEKEVEFQTYNLSQFVHPNELTQALLPIRDVLLDGKLPIVFFDEFDTNLGDTKLGWLKYFLSMMQDGQFKHGETMLKIGGAVFVFAGGTSPTYQKFLPQKESLEEQREFSDSKGPDFISRLRGYVNIRGVNPDPDDSDDKAFVIRRAILLRSILWEKVPFLFRDNVALIDPDVLQALLQVDEYKHGSRSMEAVLDMSRLAKAKPFSASMLPSIDQLNMHVNGKQFMEQLEEARRPLK